MLLATTARAGEVEAARAFRAGTIAYAAKEYRRAAQAFEHAQREAPRAAAAYNAGLAWVGAGEKARAADALSLALGMGIAGEEAKDAARLLDVLKGDLAEVRVTGPAGTRFTAGHVTLGAVPKNVHLEPGSYDLIVVFADGREQIVSVNDVTRGNTREVSLRELHPARRPSPPAAHSLAPEVRREAPPPSHAPALAFAGLALASAGAGVYLGVACLESRDRFLASGRTDADEHERAVTLRTWSTVAWAGVAALSAASVYFFARSGAGATASRHAPLRLGVGEIGGTF